MQTEDTNHIYKNGLDKVCFAHDAAYSDSKDLTKRTASDKILYSSYINNIWSADLADMQLISKFNMGFRFLLFVIDIFSKYAWVVPLKDKKGVIIVNAFQKKKFN